MGFLDSQSSQAYTATVLINGRAGGRLLFSTSELSFWGGIDPQTGNIIDRHHPLYGHCVKDAVLAIPSGRGSSTGSAVMLELLLSGNGPQALIVARQETIIPLGIIVAEEFFEKNAIPVVILKSADFSQLHNASHALVDGNQVYTAASDNELSDLQANLQKPPSATMAEDLELTGRDQLFLEGHFGEAARSAMRTIVRMASLQSVRELIDISQVHVDGCIYTGPGSLAFTEKLRDQGGKVVVPTTLNAISIDQQRWRAQRIDVSFGEAAQRQVAAYTQMGARATFTCAPYLLDSAPTQGEQVAWAESNAVVYANSVLGARSPKYPDFLDAAIALTGRAPKAGLHLAENRQASLVVNVQQLKGHTIDDSFYPLLGYHVGQLSSGRVPVLTGLKTSKPSKDDLKAFSAAFGTASSVSMFHMVGVTPEASSVEAVLAKNEAVEETNVVHKDLSQCRSMLDSAQEEEQVDLVSLGSPHFSLTEIRKLSQLCKGRTKRNGANIMVTCGRATYSLAVQAGYVAELETFGVQFINDTCWCMIIEPLIPHSVDVIMTNSAKYAHYGPALTGKRFRFGSLAECVEAVSWGVGGSER